MEKNGYCMVMGATVNGIEAQPVRVEVLVESGLPGMHIVGMPDAAVLEGRARVRAAIRSAGFTIPHGRIVVNLAPNEIRKSGAGLDMAIALGVLAATCQVDPAVVEGRLFAGELALDGDVLPARGTVAYSLAARDAGCAFVGSASCGDVIPLEGVEQLGVRNLADFRVGKLTPLRPQALGGELSLDFKDVAGQETAKRGLQIAAAGGHGVLIVGAPGSGKTMLASRIPSILPPLDEEGRLQAALIRSVARDSLDGAVGGVPPMRMPHFSVTMGGMIGGGSPVHPGELSLAHEGVLVLDKVDEFKPAVLRGVASALEQGSVDIVRASGRFSLPARVQVVAALASPCPCGCYGSANRQCTCSAEQVRVYQERVGSLVTDMADMRIEMLSVKPGEFAAEARACSADYREGVMKARAFAARRMEREGEQAGQAASVRPDSAAQALLEEAAKSCRLSGRGIAKVLKVARTIADLAQSETVVDEHVAEALAFRL